MLSETLRILAVDDEPVMRSLISSILEGKPTCCLEVASDGAEGLAKVLELRPHLLITDLLMPKLSGDDLTTQALSFDPDLTVLVMTGNGTLESAVDLMKKGVF